MRRGPVWGQKVNVKRSHNTRIRVLSNTKLSRTTSFTFFVNQVHRVWTWQPFLYEWLAFSLIKHNRSLAKNYIAHSITIVCVIGMERKSRFVCTLWAYEISRTTRIFPRIHIRQQSIVKFRICSAENVRSSNAVEFEFELRNIPSIDIVDFNSLTNSGCMYSS